METLYSWLDQTINKNPVAALTVLVAIFIFLFGYHLFALHDQIRSLWDYVDDRESAQNQKYRSLCASISTLTDLYQRLSSRIEDPAFKGNLAIARALVTLVNKLMENCNTHFCRLDNHVKSLEESLGNRLDEVESALETVEYAAKDELLDRLEAKQAIRCDPCVVTLDGQFLGEATVMISQPRGRGLAEPTRLEITTQRLDANVSALRAETSQLAPEVQTTKWVPQVGDWVKIKKPESWMYTAWMQDMDKYDGEVVQVTEIEGTAIIHDDWAFCFEWLEEAPAMPTTPEIAVAISNTGEFSRSGKPLNSDKIPEGYRKLNDSSEEPRQLGDLRWSVAEKRYVEITVDEIGYANRDNWAACRKIDPNEPPDGWRWLEVGEVIRKGDQGFENGLFYAIDSLIGIELQAHWIPMIRRNRFEVGEKVVHGDCKSLSISVVENILGDGWVDLVSDGVSTAYHVKDLAPYTEDTSPEVTVEVTGEVTGEVKPEWMPTVGERVRFKGQPAARPDWIVNHLSEYPYVLLKRSTDGVPSGGYVSQLEPAPKPEQETEAPKPRFSRGELVRIVCPKGLLHGETFIDPISKLTLYAHNYEAYLGKDGQILGPSTTKPGLWQVLVFSHGRHETILLPEAMLEKVLS